LIGLKRAIQATRADPAGKTTDPGGERRQDRAMVLSVLRLPQDRLRILGEAKHDADVRPPRPVQPLQ
jgi:hypothetical protein